MNTAKRELQEETGAQVFSLERICDYSVRGVIHAGERLDEEVYGALFFANIFFRINSLNSEIEKVEFMEDLPNSLTYPSITQQLVKRAMDEVIQGEKGTAYFLVYDENFENYPETDDPFIDWLQSEGFRWHNVYQSLGAGLWLNINNKTIACGKLGTRCFEEIGHHAVTVDEFKTIYEIYKKYRGKYPFVFN